MKKALAVVLALGVASSAYAVGIYTLPSTGTVAPTYSIVYNLAVGADGTAYVAGQGHDGAGYKSAYWSVTPAGVVSAPTFLPNHIGSALPSGNSFGLDLLSDGSLVIGGRRAGSNAAITWSNNGGLGKDANGWYGHMLPGGGEATHIADQNTIKTASNGTSFYAFGKNSTSTAVYLYKVDAATGAQTVDNFGLMVGSSSISGITPDEIAVGTTKPNSTNTAYVHTPTGGTTYLPVPAGGSGRTEAYEISDNGNIIVGAAMYGGILYQAYWKKVGSTYVADWLEDVPGATSTCAAQAVNEDGSLAGGYGYISGTYKAWIWDMNDLNSLGQPKGQSLESYLAGYGVSLPAGLTNAARIASISTVNGVTYISGYGNANNMAFVAIVPEPATALFLVLGALPLIRRRR